MHDSPRVAGRLVVVVIGSLLGGVGAVQQLALLAAPAVQFCPGGVLRSVHPPSGSPGAGEPRRVGR
ncbi:MAG: hypothetical protein LC775_00815 [Acidobacteria bacterium]|nr:hypothetical protein [Acidobacteriota bacterium]